MHGGGTRHEHEISLGIVSGISFRRLCRFAGIGAERKKEFGSKLLSEM